MQRLVSAFGGRAMLLVFVVGLAWGPVPADASILTFDQVEFGGAVVPAISGNGLPDGYGDRVTGSAMAVPGGQLTYGEAGEGFTPNIAAEYFASRVTAPSVGVSVWVDGYGDLENVLFGDERSLGFSVRLTADAGFEALLHGFDLAAWPFADETIAAVRVFAGTTLIHERTNVVVEGNTIGPRHTPFTFSTPLRGDQLTLTIDYANLAGNRHDNIGLDNVRFGQASLTPSAPIPEPAAVTMVGLGLWVWARRRPRGPCQRMLMDRLPGHRDDHALVARQPR